MSSLRDKTIKGVIWSAVERFASQGVEFIFGILIARLLLPEDYGVIAMLNIFLAISRTFIDSGFETALIRKADRTETDFSTVFYFNIAVSAICYLILWIASPFIADFYDTPLLESVTKVVALNLIFNALAGIQSAKLSIEIDFKSRANVSLIHACVSGAVGLWLAFKGYGVWALVAQSLSAAAVRTLTLWVIVRWKPRFEFSQKSFKELFSFGSKLLAAGLLNTIYNNIYSIVIGKFYSPSSLGVYSKANTLSQFPSSNVTGVFQSVLFPVLSSIQDDERRMLDVYKRFLRMSSFVVFPLMIGLAAVADPLIRVLLTDKWEGSIYLLQILCFSTIWAPVIAVNTNVLKVMGRSDYFLKVEIIKKIIGIVILCITIPMGLVPMCYGIAVVTFLSVCCDTYYTRKLIGYGLLAQLKDLFPLLLHSLIMGTAVLLVEYFMPTEMMKLIVGVLVGMTYYVLGAILCRFKEMKEILSIIKK